MLCNQNLQQHRAFSLHDFFVCSITDDGLRHILLHYGANRVQVYRRLYGILYYGNEIGKSAFIPQMSAMLIYPAELREGICQRFDAANGGAKDDVHDAMPGTYCVTWAKLPQASWPKPPSSCTTCGSTCRFQPY